MVKGTLPIRIRTEGISPPLPFSKYDCDRPLNAAVLNHPGLAVLRDPGPTIRQHLPLHIDLATIGIAPEEVLELTSPQPKEDARDEEAVALCREAGRSCPRGKLGRQAESLLDLRIG
jgi:hypothetical protein